MSLACARTPSAPASIASAKPPNLTAKPLVLALPAALKFSMNVFTILSPACERQFPPLQPSKGRVAEQLDLGLIRVQARKLYCLRGIGSLALCQKDAKLSCRA